MVRTKVNYGALTACITLAIKTCKVWDEEHPDAEHGAEDTFIDNVADHHWTHPGDGPPTACAGSMTVFAEDYTFEWLRPWTEAGIHRKIQETLQEALRLR